MGVSFHNLGLGKTDLKVFELLSRAVLNELELEFDYQKPQSPAPEHRRIRRTIWRTGRIFGTSSATTWSARRSGALPCPHDKRRCHRAEVQPAD